MSFPEPRPTPRRTGLIVGVAVGATALVAATAVATVVITRSPEQPARAAAEVTVATSAPGGPPAVTATPPAEQGVRTMGEKAGESRVTAVAYAYRQPVAKGAPRPDQEGFEWGAADVEVCVKVDGTLVRESWRLTYADHTTIEPSSSGYDSFPAPAYPWDERPVTAGQCVRGWITFPVPAGKRPAVVEYNPAGFRADWTVT